MCAQGETAHFACRKNDFSMSIDPGEGANSQFAYPNHGTARAHPYRAEQSCVRIVHSRESSRAAKPRNRPFPRLRPGVLAIMLFPELWGPGRLHAWYVDFVEVLHVGACVGAMCVGGVMCLIIVAVVRIPNVLFPFLHLFRGHR